MVSKNNTVVDMSEANRYFSDIVKSSAEHAMSAILNERKSSLKKEFHLERILWGENDQEKYFDPRLREKHIYFNIPKLRIFRSEFAIIERYRCKKSSIEETMIEMYSASIYRFEGMTNQLWGVNVLAGTLYDLNKTLSLRLDDWRKRSLNAHYPYIYLGEVTLKRKWKREVKEESILVAFGVNSNGYRNVIGIQEKRNSDRNVWRFFLSNLKRRGVKSISLIISENHSDIAESLCDCFPNAIWQRCTEDFHKSLLLMIPNSDVKVVSEMIENVQSQLDLYSAQREMKRVSNRLKKMQLLDASNYVEQEMNKTLSYMKFPRKHWKKIKTNTSMKRIMQDIKHRIRDFEMYPDGDWVVMLTIARLRYIIKNFWSVRRHLNMSGIRGQKKI